MAIQNFKAEFLEVFDAWVHHLSELIETHSLLLRISNPRLHRWWCLDHWFDLLLRHRHHWLWHLLDHRQVISVLLARCCCLIDGQLLKHAIIVDKLSFVCINPVLKHFIVILPFFLFVIHGFFDVLWIDNFILVEVQLLIIFLLVILFWVFDIIPGWLFGSPENNPNSVPFEFVLISQRDQGLQRKVQKWLFLLFNMLLLLLELLLNGL